MKKNPSLIITAGKGCFTSCKGCYQFFGCNLVSTDILLDFIKRYKEKFNLNKITLAGGDPLARNDIVYLVDELSKMNLSIYMDTVGKPFVGSCKTIFNQNENINYIDPATLSEKISVIGIPLDGYNTEQINYFRRGITIEEIETILFKLNKNNYDICINTVVHKKNIDDLFAIYSIIKKYPNIKKWQLFQFSPIGELGYRNRNLYEISDDIFYIKTNQLVEQVGKTNLVIEIKSNSYRKLNYILVNSDGKVWQPDYNLNKVYFSDLDKNSKPVIIGTISDEDIIEKIKLHLDKISNNIGSNEVL